MQHTILVVEVVEVRIQTEHFVQSPVLPQEELVIIKGVKVAA
jgi:hypothetical protein